MASITAELDLEISKLRRKLGQANARLDRFAQSGKKHGNAFSRSFQEGAGKLLKGGLAGLGLGAVVGVAGLGVAAGKNFVSSLKEAAGNEQLEVSFDVLTGSPEKAMALMSTLRKDAASTPISFEALGGGARKLLAFGEASESIPSTLRRIGDISTAIQAPIGEIAEIYGKARVQGTLFAEDINQLTGRGIPVIQQFAKQLGVSEGEVKKLGSEGKITFDHLQQAFIDLTNKGGTFHGMMERQSKTVTGLVSTLLDNYKEVRLEFGKPINESLKPILEDAVGLIDSMKARAKEFGESVAEAIDFTRAAFQELGGKEILSLAGDSLKLAFMDAVNALGRGLQALFAMARESDFLSGIENRLEKAAETLKIKMLEAARTFFQALEASKVPFAAFEAKKADNNLKNFIRDLDEKETEMAQPKEGSFAVRFATKYFKASDLFETGEVRSRLRQGRNRIRRRAETNRREREQAGESEPSPPRTSGPIQAAGSSFGGNSVQNAVNALFNRPLEAEARKTNAMLAKNNQLLREIRDKKPETRNVPPVAQGAFGSA